MLEGDRKSTKVRISMGVIIRDYADKGGNNTHLVVIMHLRLSQNISIPDLTNQN